MCVDLDLDLDLDLDHTHDHTRSTGALKPTPLQHRPSPAPATWTPAPSTDPDPGHQPRPAPVQVAEHVPKRFEATFLQNIDRANRRGVVLSWSRLQGSRGHVNPKGPKAVISTFVQRGYEHDRNATRMLRKCAKHPNFRNCILVFRHR